MHTLLPVCTKKLKNTPINREDSRGRQRSACKWIVSVRRSKTRHLLSSAYSIYAMEYKHTCTHTHLKQSRLTHYSGLTPWGHGKALCGCPWSLQGNGERMGCACLELFHLQRHDGFQATTSSETFHTHHVNKGTSTYTHTRDGAFEFWQQLFSCPDFY